MEKSTWNLIGEGFWRWPKSKGSRVEPEDFNRAMEPFESQIDTDYREFVLRFGCGIVGSERIYGLSYVPRLGTIGGKKRAPEITAFFKEKHWPGIDDWFIFSVDGGGNPIGFAKDRTVWLSDRTNFPGILQIASGFEDFLLKWCLKVKPVSDAC